MLPSDELRVFVTVVAVSSVTRAAVELRVPRATVSRKLGQLEERLGVRLLRRTTRSMQLTEAGQAFHGKAAAALDAIRLAEASVKPVGSSASGDVYVSMPPMLGGGLPDMLADFAREHPSIRLTSTSRIAGSTSHASASMSPSARAGSSTPVSPHEDSHALA